MKQNQRVYIKGDTKRYEEVIKVLTDLGAQNTFSYTGENENAYYFINPEGRIGMIDNTPGAIKSDILPYIKEFYKEIKLPRWKPEYGDQYFYIDSMGTVQQESWYYTYINKSNYEFGNCFRTYEEADVASNKIKEMLTK